jgi:hypothetical protein
MSQYVFGSINESRIIVTGPQRAGTTICAAMLAEFKGYQFYPDEAIGQNDLTRLGTLLKNGNPFCLQAPALFPVVHLLSYADMAVVVMLRSPREIFASQERIGWHGGLEELGRYALLDEETIGKIPDPDFAIASLKYFMWFDMFAREMTLPVYYVDYNSLDWHPLWVNKEERGSFEPRQIDPVHTNSLDRK